MQGFERIDREFTDAELLARHLVPAGCMFAFLAAHRAEVFPTLITRTLAAHPECRFAYVDQDPVVVSHARALLAGMGAIALQGDLADPDAILADPVLQRLITLAEPAAVILAMVLYFIGYYEDALWDHRQIPRPHGTR